MLPPDLSDYVKARTRKVSPILEDPLKEQQLVAWAEKAVEGKAFLGLKTADKGLFVIGAGRGGRFAGDCSHSGRQGIQRGVLGVERRVDAWAIDLHQAGDRREYQLIPPSVGQRVDFSHANADILRIRRPGIRTLATTRPSIPRTRSRRL